MHFCNRQCADTRRQPLVGKDWRRVGGYRGRQGRDEEHPNLWNMQMRMAQSAMRSQSYCLAARGRPEQCEWLKETHDAIFLPMCQGWPHLFLRCCRQLLCGERVKRARCWKGNVSVKLRQEMARVLSHKGVMVEGRPALLRQSYMDCCRGGRIVIIFNEKTAIKAAAYISSCNTNALWWQMGNQVRCARGNMQNISICRNSLDFCYFYNCEEFVVFSMPT